MLAAVTPFIGGAAGIVLAVVPIGIAIWLIVRSQWPPVTQVIVTVAVVALAIGLVLVFLVLVTATSEGVREGLTLAAGLAG